MDVCVLRPVQVFVTPWTVAHQAPLFMEFTSKEYWSGLPFPSPREFPDPGIAPTPFASSALVATLFTTEPPGKPKDMILPNF